MQRLSPPGGYRNSFLAPFFEAEDAEAVIHSLLKRYYSTPDEELDSMRGVSDVYILGRYDATKGIHVVGGGYPKVHDIEHPDKSNFPLFANQSPRRPSLELTKK